MHLVSRVATIAVLICALTGPARADGVSSVIAKIGGAAAGVTSFVVHIRVNGTTGVSGTMTFVRPMSMKTEFSMGAMTVQSYLVDGNVYVYTPYVGWQQATVDTLHALPQSMNIAESLKSAVVKPLPDRQEDGDTVGVISVDAKLPALAGPTGLPAVQHMVCSYDLATYRMRTCANTLMTMTYDKYNDPANVVVLPPDAKNAPPMTLPSAAPPVAMPAPAPTASAGGSTVTGTPAPTSTPAAPPR